MSFTRDGQYEITTICVGQFIGKGANALPSSGILLSEHVVKNTERIFKTIKVYYVFSATTDLQVAIQLTRSTVIEHFYIVIRYLDE